MDVLGLVVGNLIGGKLADRQLMPTLLGSLLLALVMGLMSFALHSQWLTVLFVALLGAASFATVPPLQMWVLERPAAPARAWPPASTSAPSTSAMPWAPGWATRSSTRA